MSPLQKNLKNPKKSQKSKDFFEDLKSGKNPKKSKNFQKKSEKIQKIPKKNSKNLKNPSFFWGFKIRITNLRVNNSSISVFKSFFIHKILVHPKKSGKKFLQNPKNLKNSEKSEKSKKFRKNLNNPKNLKKSKYFFEDLKSVHPIWEWTTPRLISALN